jgi:hypothetical protein
VPIDVRDLYLVDVNDELWFLAEDEPQQWWHNDVRKAINAMLQRDRADEEDTILAKERTAMRVWFAEEWAGVAKAMTAAGEWRLM